MVVCDDYDKTDQNNTFTDKAFAAHMCAPYFAGSNFILKKGLEAYDCLSCV